MQPIIMRSAQAALDWQNQLVRAGSKEPQIGVMHYQNPAIIYGRRGGKTEDAMQRALERSCTILQRRTGGGAVLAGSWLLGFDILLPPHHPIANMSLVQAFNWLGQSCQNMLMGCGIDTNLVSPNTIQAHNEKITQAGLDWICFAGVSHGELLDNTNRKILGISQARGRWGVLLSGGLLLNQTPWDLLAYVCLGQANPKSGRDNENNRNLQQTIQPYVSQGLKSIAPDFDCANAPILLYQHLLQHVKNMC